MADGRSPEDHDHSTSIHRLRISESGFEITATTDAERALLQRLASRVNGPSSPQPYLVEAPDGAFRLYLGEAAERARTAQGIIEKKEAEREGFEPSVEL